MKLIIATLLSLAVVSAHASSFCDAYVTPNPLAINQTVTETDKALRDECLENERRKADGLARHELEAKQEMAEAQAKADAIHAEIDRRKNMPYPKIGMTAKFVMESSNWGMPETVNRTTVKNATHEQWVYQFNRYLYFVNGKLIGIQD